MLVVGPPRPETKVGVYDGYRSLRTFAYVETREPLLVYGDNTQRDRYDDREEELDSDDTVRIAQDLRCARAF